MEKRTKTKILNFISYIDKKIDLRKFIKFGITGVLNTAVDWGLFTVCSELFKFDAKLSQFIGMFIAMLNSFIINKLWTFKKTKKFEWQELMKFLIINTSSLMISVMSIYLFHDIMGINKYIAKIPIAVITIFINYFGNKFFVFK